MRRPGASLRAAVAAPRRPSRPRANRRGARSAGAGAAGEREAPARLLAGAGLPEDGDITELSAGFCNWVYRADYPAPTGSVVAVLLAARAAAASPAMLGWAMRAAAELGRGCTTCRRRPRRRLRAGRELTEVTFRRRVAAAPLGTIASHWPAALARLPHTRMPAAGAAGSAAALASAAVAARGGAATSAERQPAAAAEAAAAAAARRRGAEVALWAFIRKMLTHIRSAPESAVASAGIPLAAVEAEVARMRERFGELQLPVVLGHGDLKPSNVMAGADAPPPGADEAVSFIDFELAGAHYRGYDLYKLFRTSGELSQPGLRAFLRAYLDEVRGACDLSDDGGASASSNSTRCRPRRTPPSRSRGWRPPSSSSSRSASSRTRRRRGAAAAQRWNGASFARPRRGQRPAPARGASAPLSE